MTDTNPSPIIDHREDTLATAIVTALVAGMLAIGVGDAFALPDLQTIAVATAIALVLSVLAVRLTRARR